MPPNPLSVIDQVSSAMSVSTLQHRVIASNIANRDAQGYQRLKLQFDAALAAGDAAGRPDDPPNVDVRVTVDPAGRAVSLEQDMVSLSSNSAQYQSLARVLNRYFSMLSTITNNGRG